MKKVAYELLKIAKTLVALEFDTKEQLEKYKKEHDVRKDTKLTVKHKEEKKPVKNFSSFNDEQLSSAKDLLKRPGDVQTIIKFSDTKYSEEQLLYVSRAKPAVLPVLRHPDCTSGILDKFSNNPNEEIRQEVASNHKTSPETLDKLSTDENGLVKFFVAGNENTSPETLEKLITNKETHGRIKRKGLRNPNTPEKVLRGFADNEDYHTSLSLNKNTPSDILSELSDGNNPVASYFSSKELESRGIEFPKKKFVSIVDSMEESYNNDDMWEAKNAYDTAMKDESISDEEKDYLKETYERNFEVVSNDEFRSDDRYLRMPQTQYQKFQKVNGGRAKKLGVQFTPHIPYTE